LGVATAKINRSTPRYCPQRLAPLPKSGVSGQILNIRYGQLTMVLIAQAAIHQLRQRWGPPCVQWDATHLARNLFEGLEGDVRVEQQTIVVTLYNPPNASLLQHHYEHLPDKLAREGVSPEIPWLYNFKLDFRFR
jgi:hypothetical protein